MQSLRRTGFTLLRTEHNIIFSKKLFVSTVSGTENIELKSWEDIPGPLSLPIIGQLLHFMPGGALHNPKIHYTEVLYNKYGPIVRLGGFLGTPKMVCIYDPDALEHILRSEDYLPERPAFLSIEYYRKHYKNNPDSSTTEPTGLVTDQGELWKTARKTINPIMLNTKTIKLYNKTLDEVTEALIERLRFIRKKNNMFDDFKVEINKWTLEAVAAVVLGARLNAFDPNIPDDSPIKRLIKNVHDVFELAESLDLKPGIWRFISTPNFRKAMKAYGEQYNLNKYFVRKSMEELKKLPPRTNEEKGILEKLGEIDEKTAVRMGSDSLFAGVDSTANVMISCLHFLATNQEKQNKLREEIKSDDQKQLYLKACIKESIRLLPAVPANLRKTTKEYNIMGYKIPKGIFMVLNHQLLCRLENNYLKAKEYIPERWIVDKSDPLHYSNAHRISFSPFGFGTRSCIGRRIAQIEMETFLTKMIQNFHIEWNGPPPKLKTSVVNHFPERLNFVLKDVA